MSVSVNDGGIEKEVKMIYANVDGIDKPVLGGGKERPIDYLVSSSARGARLYNIPYVELGDLVVMTNPRGNTPSGFSAVFEGTLGGVYTHIWDGTSPMSGTAGDPATYTNTNVFVFRGVSGIGVANAYQPTGTSSSKDLNVLEGISPGAIVVHALSGRLSALNYASGLEAGGKPYVSLSAGYGLISMDFVDIAPGGFTITSDSTSNNAIISFEVRP